MTDDPRDTYNALSKAQDVLRKRRDQARHGLENPSEELKHLHWPLERYERHMKEKIAKLETAIAVLETEMRIIWPD